MALALRLNNALSAMVTAGQKQRFWRQCRLLRRWQKRVRMSRSLFSTNDVSAVTVLADGCYREDRMAEREWTQEEIDVDVFSCDDPANDCDCADVEPDILTGRVECFRCGRVWYT